jgi:putative sterol carrier protein
MRTSVLLAGLIAIAAAGAANAAPYMSAEWAAEACKGWNANPELTSNAKMADGWIKNDKGRGYKTIHMYRTECGEAGKVEMKIQSQGGKAICTYGGPVAAKSMDYDVDYLMHAKTDDWLSKMNPATAMMFGDLKFTGPKIEAMKVMGPFTEFLHLAAKIPGDKACPAK